MIERHHALVHQIRAAARLERAIQIRKNFGYSRRIRFHEYGARRRASHRMRHKHDLQTEMPRSQVPMT